MNPDRSNEVEKFREWVKRYDRTQPELGQLATRSDAELAEAIDGAKRWIGGRPLSWNTAAAFYLLEGRYR